MEGEFLKRIDRHMERGNEIMRRGNEIMDRVEAEMRLTREQHADHMREMREARRGYQLAIRQLIRFGRENQEVIRENQVVIRENREAMRENREAMRDMREASQAHTQAILALLDRLENGGAGPATA